MKPCRVALSEARWFPSSVRGPVDFWAFRRLARRRASEGVRRIGSGDLGDASVGRDGSFGVFAGGFFLVGMDDPLAVRVGAEDKRTEGRSGGSR